MTDLLDERERAARKELSKWSVCKIAASQHNGRVLICQRAIQKTGTNRTDSDSTTFQQKIEIAKKLKSNQMVQF
jgi:hypothetical protein